MKSHPGAWHRSRRAATMPVVFRPIFITLVMVGCFGVFSTADLVRAQSTPWQSMGTGDCPGRDVSSSTGPAPDPVKCDAAFAGFTAVCWSGACTYKNVATAACTGGANPGRMYRCAPATPPPPTPPGLPAMPVDLGTSWTVVEGGMWYGTWTRRAGTNVFDAVWKNRRDQVVKDTLELQPVVGGRITLNRVKVKLTYTGTLSADGNQITGPAAWYGPGQTWTATINRPNAVAQSIVGEWEFYRGGQVGTPNEDKPVGSGMLVIWEEDGAYRGRLAFERRQIWEDLPDLTFDKGALTFSRAPTANRPVTQYNRAVVTGDKLAGTVKQEPQTLKWWGTKLKRESPPAP
jgi:hypothetical protein